MPTYDSNSEGDKAGKGHKEALRRIQKAKQENASVLDLKSLQLTSVPGELGQLAGLTRLYLSFNLLVSVPGELGQLAGLQWLDLSHNQLTGVPEELGRLRKLETLRLDSNQLTSVPEQLGQLAKLKRLDLDHNRLTSVPGELGQLTRLEKLYLSDNQLAELPESFRQLKRLTRLFLHENSGLGLPDEVLGATQEAVAREWAKTKPPSEILRYYFRIHPPGGSAGASSAWAVLEARIIVIGDGRAGKTSLVRQLLRGLPAQESEPSTRDVVVVEWPVRLREQEVRVNVWDFGGQKQMHAAHPYFFTTRTLYVVVAEAGRDQQDRVEYWLKMVAKYGENARAVVVVNKNDGHAMALDRPKLLDRYRDNLPENSKDAFFSTSCTTGTGIAELKAAIQRELEGMEQIWALWPAEWFRVKQAILKLRQPHPEGSALSSSGKSSPAGPTHGPAREKDTLTYEAWEEVCDKCGVTTEQDREDLLENLGHLGLVTCFPRNDRLRALGVLNPDWVTKGIYPLLVDTSLAAKGGLLTMADLGALLPADRYPRARHPWLVDLMKAFELLFEDNRGRLLLPGLLPTDSPPWAQPQEWEGPVTLHLELRYDLVLPESVISQFIVRCHREARRPGEWWRHGIALRRGNCEALVRAHMTEKDAKIELRLLGPQLLRREFLFGILETLQDPRDSTPPVLHVILGSDCAPKHNDLVVHAQSGIGELPFIIEGQSVRRPLAPILDMIAAPAGPKATGEKYPVKIDIHNEIKPNMSHESYSNSGTNQGIIGKHNQQSVSDSFNTQKADLTALLQALRQEFANLPPKAAETVQPYVEAIEAEAKKPKPSGGFLSVTKTGLVEAAKTCAEMAPSLIKAASAVVDFVSGAS